MNERPTSSNRQSFLGGAAVLALATAIVKILGAFYKIPLQNIIGETGYSFFSTAYDIYSVLLMISTAGLPVAMSRMISEARALERYEQIHRIYSVALWVFFAIGLVGTLGMALFCAQLATWCGQKDAWFAILCLSPAVLSICINSANRGFFQGQGDMRPTSVSQVLEAVCRLALGLAAAYCIMRSFYSDNGTVDSAGYRWAAGGAILGVTIGSLLSIPYLFGKHRRAAKRMVGGDPTCISRKRTLRSLLAIAVPITIGAAGLQIITLIDTMVYMFRLKGAAGFTQEQANSLKGIYNFCQTIFNLPASFMSPLVVSMIPALTEHITMKNKRGERMVTESAVRVMALIAMPCGMGLATLAAPIYGLLASHTEQSLATAGPVLSILGVSVLFNALVLVTNAIQQAHGDVTTPVINMLLGGVVKVALNFVLVANPKLNIIGAAIGTLACYVCITVLNLIVMSRRHYHLALARTMGKVLVASCVLGAVALGTYYGLSGLLHGKLLTIAAILAGGVSYLIMVVALRVITREDCELLPKGDKIAKILRAR